MGCPPYVRSLRTLLQEEAKATDTKPAAHAKAEAGTSRAEKASKQGTQKTASQTKHSSVSSTSSSSSYITASESQKVGNLPMLRDCAVPTQL